MKHPFVFTLALALLVSSPVLAQSGQQRSPDDEVQSGDKLDPRMRSPKAPPRSDNDNARRGDESSSKDRDVDISPPADDNTHEGSMLGGPGPAPGVDDVNETKPWNPHRADKDVEVGLYYFKERNYKAAESRYQEALYWQDNHAEAHYRLGEAEEKLGKVDEAREHYQAYLKILPNGGFARDARKALDRLATKSSGKLEPKSIARP